MANAQTWIGAGAEGDSLDLTKISVAVSAQAAALHQILNSSKVSGMVRIRREASTARPRGLRRFGSFANLSPRGVS